ncbi:MAG: hypothetical protein NVSMB29_13510 [Candidatus Dormibacteria bacterium]
MDSRPIPSVRPVEAPGQPARAERLGAIALPPRHRGFDRLPLVILGLLLLALVLFLAASRIHGRAEAPASGSSAAVAAAPVLPLPPAQKPAPGSASPALTPVAAGGSGQPVVLEPALLPQYVDKPVHGQSSVVQSIAGVGPGGEPDDERFFVGSSPQEQILIVVDGATGPALTIVPGQHVSFNGVLRKYAGPSTQLHVSGPAEQSVAQLGYYVIVNDAAEVQAG